MPTTKQPTDQLAEQSLENLERSARERAERREPRRQERTRKHEEWMALHQERTANAARRNAASGEERRLQHEANLAKSRQEHEEIMAQLARKHEERMAQLARKHEERMAQLERERKERKAKSEAQRAKIEKMIADGNASRSEQILVESQKTLDMVNSLKQEWQKRQEALKMKPQVRDKIIAAIEAGNVVELEGLLNSEYFDPKMIVKGQTLLEYAVNVHKLLVDNLDIVRVVLDKVEPKFKGGGEKALIDALGYNDHQSFYLTDIVELLLSHSEIHPNIRYQGWSLLELLASRDYNLTELIVGYMDPKDPNFEKSWHNALLNALYNGRYNMVSLLLFHEKFIGCNLNSENEHGKNAIHYAMEGRRDPSVIELLLSDSRLDPNAGVESNFMICFAALHNHVGILNRLLQRRDIQPNVQDADGKTALLLAVEQQNTEAVELLVSHPGTDITIADKNDRTPLAEAVYGGNPKILALVADKADENIATLSGYNSESPDIENIRNLPREIEITKFVKERHLNRVNFFLGKLSADNLSDADRQEVLYTAARYNHSDYIKELRTLVGGSIPYGSMCEALIIAAEEGHVNVVTLFIETFKEQIETADYQSDKGNISRLLGVVFEKAFTKGHATVMQELINNYPNTIEGIMRSESIDDPNASSGDEFETPIVQRIHYALRHGYRDVIILLLDKFKDDYAKEIRNLYRFDEAEGSNVAENWFKLYLLLNAQGSFYSLLFEEFKESIQSLGNETVCRVNPFKMSDTNYTVMECLFVKAIIEDVPHNILDLIEDYTLREECIKEAFTTAVAHSRNTETIRFLLDNFDKNIITAELIKTSVSSLPIEAQRVQDITILKELFLRGDALDYIVEHHPQLVLRLLQHEKELAQVASEQLLQIEGENYPADLVNLISQFTFGALPKMLQSSAASQSIIEAILQKHDSSIIPFSSPAAFLKQLRQSMFNHGYDKFWGGQLMRDVDKCLGMLEKPLQQESPAAQPTAMEEPSAVTPTRILEERSEELDEIQDGDAVQADIAETSENSANSAAPPPSIENPEIAIAPLPQSGMQRITASGAKIITGSMNTIPQNFTEAGDFADDNSLSILSDLEEEIFDDSDPYSAPRERLSSDDESESGDEVDEVVEIAQSDEQQRTEMEQPVVILLDEPHERVEALERAMLERIRNREADQANSSETPEIYLNNASPPHPFSTISNSSDPRTDLALSLQSGAQVDAMLTNNFVPRQRRSIIPAQQYPLAASSAATPFVTFPSVKVVNVPENVVVALSTEVVVLGGGFPATPLMRQVLGCLAPHSSLPINFAPFKVTGGSTITRPLADKRSMEYLLNYLMRLSSVSNSGFAGPQHASGVEIEVLEEEDAEETVPPQDSVDIEKVKEDLWDAIENNQSTLVQQILAVNPTLSADQEYQRSLFNLALYKEQVEAADVVLQQIYSNTVGQEFAEGSVLVNAEVESEYAKLCEVETRFLEKIHNMLRVLDTPINLFREDWLSRKIDDVLSEFGIDVNESPEALDLYNRVCKMEAFISLLRCHIAKIKNISPESIFGISPSAFGYHSDDSDSEPDTFQEIQDMDDEIADRNEPMNHVGAPRPEGQQELEIQRHAPRVGMERGGLLTTLAMDAGGPEAFNDDGNGVSSRNNSVHFTRHHRRNTSAFSIAAAGCLGSVSAVGLEYLVAEHIYGIEIFAAGTSVSTILMTVGIAAIGFGIGYAIAKNTSATSSIASGALRQQMDENGRSVLE
jgi:ankyrin repeat protein